jgi:hypothetical protein
MLRQLTIRPLNGFILKPVSQRHFSAAAQIRDRFEAAWTENKKLHKTEKHEINDKAEYGAGYIQKNLKRLKKGYVHPYHSVANPMLFSTVSGAWKVMSDLVGPEQVSPHYESLSRSRRGLIFLAIYIGTITSVSRLGGWDHNEWLRGLIFHHEYLIALYVGYAEVRHFTWLPGPKFTVFYDVFSRYESMQLASQFNDTAEQASLDFYQKTKQQVEYKRIHDEYQFIKKRSLVNYLTSERFNLEKHFHDRTLALLSNIVSFEEQNLRNKITSIARDAFAETLKKVEHDRDGSVRRQAFVAALDGIKKGSMDFKSDPVLPILKQELTSRTDALRGLSAEDQDKLLSLTEDQKRSLSVIDKAHKDKYLSAAPVVQSQGLKNHEKFLKHLNYLSSLNKK